MARAFKFRWSLGLACAATALPVIAAEQMTLVPEEYLSTGEHGTAFANGGSLSSSGFSAVRSNPAMIANEKQYTLGGGYHWPSVGREYYQAGVVDAKTASIAAGLSYTSALDPYKGEWDKSGAVAAGDTPVTRRVAIALAQNLKTFSLGISGQFIEAADPLKAFDEDADKVKGFTFGAGVIGGITPALRVGFSVENLANKKIAFAAPTIYRAGLAWGVGREVNLYLDMRQREAIATYEAAPPSLTLLKDNPATYGGYSAEQSIMGGVSAKAFDLLRVSAAAGATKAGSDTKATVAAGLGLVNRAFVLAYGVQRPDMKQSGIHHAVNLGFDIAL